MLFQILLNSGLSVRMRLLLVVFLPLAVIFSLTAHEYMHGLVSQIQGDPTPRYAGRLTLSPISHIDPLGLVCLIVCGFGWAKPVPVNPRYYKDPKKGMAITAVSGPAVNLFIGIYCTLLLSVLVWIYETGIYAFIPVIDQMSQTLYYVLSTALYIVLYLNIMLAIFNMVPVPPLDGSRLMLAFLPQDKYFRIMRYEKFIMLALFFVLWTGMLNGVFEAIADFFILGVGNAVFFVLNGLANILFLPG